MYRFIRFLSATLPFFAAEAIQYIIVNVLFLIPIVITTEVLYFYSIIGIMVSGVVFIYWYLYEIRGEVRGSVNHVATLKNISLLSMIGIGCQFFFSGLMSLLVPYLTEIFKEYSNVVDRLTSGNYVLVVLLVVLVAPITEELIFRGVILHMANRHVTFVGANLLQAVLFGIYHGNLVQGIYAALIGFLLGFIYYKFKTIYASILLHIFINASAYLVSLIPNSRSYHIVTMAAGGILFVIALAILHPLKSNVITPASEDAYSSLQ